MKQWISLILSAVLLAGCSTQAPEPKEEEDNQKDAEKGKHIDMTADDSKDETS